MNSTVFYILRPFEGGKAVAVPFWPRTVLHAEKKKSLTATECTGHRNNRFSHTVCLPKK
jgi:hypothetical protein